MCHGAELNFLPPPYEPHSRALCRTYDVNGVQTLTRYGADSWETHPQDVTALRYHQAAWTARNAEVDQHGNQMQYTQHSYRDWNGNMQQGPHKRFQPRYPGEQSDQEKAQNRRNYTGTWTDKIGNEASNLTKF